MQKNKDIIAIYSRKSRFTGKGESIGNQVDLCRRYIQSTFGSEYADTAVVFEDEGFSGGNLNRPDFKRMMKTAQEHGFKAVVVYRLDRISRNISDFSSLIQELGRLGIDFVSIRENFDTSSPMGRAMMYIASVFSQLERETIAERIRDNMNELAKTGRWLGGTTPTGYASESVKSVTVDGKSKKACKLKLIPEEAETVQKIYQLYNETDSLTMTEAELLQQKIKTKTGRNFTRFAIKAILQNPVYLIADKDAYNYFVEKQAEVFSGLEAFDGVHGILAYNRTDQQKGRATVYLPASEWIVSVGQHTGLIPSKMWIEIQHSLERNRCKAYRKPRSNQALLTGLLWCSCGNRMYPKRSKRLTAQGEPRYTYVCKMKERSKNSLCSCKNADGNLLDETVIQQIKQLSEDKQEFLMQLEKSKRIYRENKQTCDSKLEQMRQRQKEIRHKIDSVVDAITAFADSSAVVHLKTKLEELHAQEQELKAGIAALEAACTPPPMMEEEFELMRQLLSSLQYSIDEMTPEQKRTAMHTLVRKVVWDGESAHIILFGASWEDSFVIG